MKQKISDCDLKFYLSVQKHDLIRKMAELDIAVAVQPRALVELGDGVIRSYGRERLPMFCPYRSLMEAGI